MAPLNQSFRKLFRECAQGSNSRTIIRRTDAAPIQMTLQRRYRCWLPFFKRSDTRGRLPTLILLVCCVAAEFVETIHVLTLLMPYRDGAVAIMSKIFLVRYQAWCSLFQIGKGSSVQRRKDKPGITTSRT